MLLYAFRLLPDRLAVLMDPDQKVKSFMEWLHDGHKVGFFTRKYLELGD